MCLIVFAWDVHPIYKLVLAANRDEFFQRPTSPAGFWQDHPEILAGRDLEAGGTWLGTTPKGRWAALTNYRDPREVLQGAPSRGHLVKGFLASSLSPANYLKLLPHPPTAYNGFNLLVADKKKLYYFSNKENQVRPLPPGIYGLSNHLIDTPWPKVVNAKKQLTEMIKQPLLETGELIAMMQSQDIAPDSQLPNTGVGLDWERKLSPMFIATENYGTCCSTALLIDRHENTHFQELSYQPLLVNRSFHLQPS